MKYADFKKPNGEERKLLKKIYKRGSGNLSRRAHIILLTSRPFLSFSVAQIARICFCSRKTIYNTLDRYMQDGIVGLFDKPRSSDILDTLRTKTPLESKISLHQKWTLELVVKYLEQELNIRVTPQSVSNWLKNHGWSYHRSKRELQPPKPVTTEEKKAVLKLLNSIDPQKEVIVFLDQSGFYLDGLVTGIWMPKGDQKKIPVSGNHDKLWVYGVFGPHTEKVYYRITEKCNSGETIRFLHQIRQRFPGKNIHIVLDNASFHHSKKTQAFVERYPELVFHFLPARATKLNPIERIWLFAKGVVVAAAIFTDTSELYHMLRKFFWHFNENRIEYHFSLDKLYSNWKNWPEVESREVGV